MYGGSIRAVYFLSLTIFLICRGYVVGALQADPSLHFPHGRLTDLLKAEDASWNRHKEWCNNLDAAVYINMSKT